MANQKNRAENGEGEMFVGGSMGGLTGHAPGGGESQHGQLRAVVGQVAGQARPVELSQEEAGLALEEECPAPPVGGLGDLQLLQPHQGLTIVLIINTTSSMLISSSSSMLPPGQPGSRHNSSHNSEQNRSQAGLSSRPKFARIFKREKIDL